MVAAGALDTPARVVELAGDHTAREAAAFGGVVRGAVLAAAQQDVAAALAADTREEASARRAERQTDAALGARAHQRRRSARVGKGEDAGQHMQRIARGLLSVPAGDDVLAVERQIRVFRGYKQRVEQLSHGSLSPPIASAR